MASARVATRISSNSLAQDHQDQMAVQAGIEIFQLGSQLFGKAQFARAFCVWEGLCLLLSTTLSSSSSDSTDETYWVAALQEARQSAHQVQNLADATFSSPVDTYLEDECDVGPRPFCQPLPITTTTSLESLYLLGVYHCGLAQHAQGHSSVAARFYTQVLAESLEDSFQLEQHSSSLLHVMVHNNLAQLRYAEHAEEVASRHMEAALVLAKQALSSSPSFPLTIPQLATLLSNWCRIRWMLGDLSDAIHAAMEEILHMRSQHLPTDHVDVAASHFNLGVSFYSNRHFDAALKHLTKYLEIASACNNNKTKKQTKGDAASRLDPIPALCYVLLTKVMTSWKSRSTARDIEEGVQSLLEKRSELGCHNPEVASILNYVGTLLFHQNDLEYALLFFQEELRVEEELHQASLCSSEEVSVSVTCNNIGRILQELGRFPEAIYYYERSLESEFGSSAVTTSSRSTKAVPSSQATKTLSSTKKNSPVNTTSTQTASSSSSRSNHNNTKKATSILSNLHNMPSATMNLYSTVWYNLGLIHDKMGAFADAIHAFEMSLHLRTAMLGPDHSDVACLLYNIGVLQMEQGRLDDATSSFREALRIRRICLSGGQLNDKHIVRTLQKLAALHKAKGHIAGALLIGQEVICLLQSIYFQQQESSTAWRLEWAAAWREVAELHHATSQLTAALHAATESLSVLRRQTSKKSPARTTVWMEHECATLLLMGSLQHELCQPLQAQATFGLVEQILSQQQQQHMTLSPSLLPMREVSHLLASSAGAPQA